MKMVRAIVSSNGFMSHGYCYLWNTNLVWLHGISDSLIGLACLSIPIMLVYFISKRRDLPFNRMFLCFGVFVLACFGATHFMEVWNLWHAYYWLSGITKAITAAASVTAAILPAGSVPHALTLPSPESMRREIVERKRFEEALRNAKLELELRVNERTAELTNAIQRMREEIAQRRRTEEKLRRSEERFRLLVDTVQDYAIFMLTPTGIITSWNEGAERIKGCQAEEIIGQHFSRFYLPEDVARGKPQMGLEKAAVQGRYTDEGWRARQDGSRFWASIVITALRDEQGKLIGFSKITRDLTERERSEEALRTAQADLAHVTRLTTMGELTASIAHEINQPLSAIVTNANACRRMLAGPSPDLNEVQDAVTDIAKLGSTAGEVISRVRMFLKKAVLAKAELDINLVIQDVLALIPNELARHNISVVTELRPGLAPVLGDRIQLQQVILNLIMNGIEAMTAVTDRPRVLLIRSQAHESGSVQVVVHDSGAGLDAKTIDHIFDIFFTTKPAGMGMGLAISRSIVEAHGGKLWPVPNENKGATFEFTLPACA
jgi:PAS domain S-box-containing protein